MLFSLPRTYREAGIEELRQRIQTVREKLGRKLCILTHHYQRIEIVEFGDRLGDSYDLSRMAANQEGVEVIVFCGVRFMAEAADVLSAEHQRVYLPNPLAGCPMADMADMTDVLQAWDYLEQFGGEKRIMPISYMNTTADLKAFTGKRDGLICTSSNAPAAFKYGLDRCDKVFFFPDENLGYNTGIKFGLKPEDMVIWDFSREGGGLTRKQIDQATIILWKGHCHVHTTFTADHIRQVREQHPDVRIIVHPECVPEVVAAADANGSTRFIVEYCESAPSGSVIAIGTEINLINRMALQFPDKKIFELSGQTCPVCANMYRTTLNDLAYCLENFANLKPVTVSEPTRADALIALQKMLEIT
ncbi:MAG: quinolinate synthase NadA [candidate division Zixibacteria bacterium]|nr:quinolinate synthase NadA [candidate division Zixibacteria bacterium]